MKRFEGPNDWEAIDRVKSSKKLMVECVNAHDKCYEGGECPYCEPVVPLRNTDGTFRGLDNG